MYMNEECLLHKKRKTFHIDKYERIHNFTCSKFCDIEKHKELGFSIFLFHFFEKKIFFEKIDEIKKYIYYKSTFF